MRPQRDRARRARSEARGRWRTTGAAVLGALALAALVHAWDARSASGRDTESLSVERAADFIHDVIQADRTVYTREVVNRLQNDEKVLEAHEHFREDKALPLPAQMLRMGAALVAEQGRFRYSLISDAAINKANLPKNEFETAGIAAVRADPATPHRARMTLGGRRYFMALYADRAVANACIQCHNAHAQSPRHDWQAGDVMGAVVVTLPLD